MMNRRQMEQLLIDASSEGSDFTVTVPHSEVSAALTILKHLEAAGQFTSFARREAISECGDCPAGECGCINIYGYTG